MLKNPLSKWLSYLRPSRAIFVLNVDRQQVPGQMAADIARVWQPVLDEVHGGSLHGLVVPFRVPVHHDARELHKRTADLGFGRKNKHSLTKLVVVQRAGIYLFLVGYRKENLSQLNSYSTCFFVVFTVST